MIPSRYSQLEEELGNLVCNLEIFFLKKYENMYDRTAEQINSPPSSKKDRLLSSCKDYCRFIGNPKTRSLRSVRSWTCFVDSKSSEEELSGYLTNWFSNNPRQWHIFVPSFSLFPFCFFFFPLRINDPLHRTNSLFRWKRDDVNDIKYFIILFRVKVHERTIR